MGNVFSSRRATEGSDHVPPTASQHDTATTVTEEANNPLSSAALPCDNQLTDTAVLEQSLNTELPEHTMVSLTLYDPPDEPKPANPSRYLDFGKVTLKKTWPLLNINENPVDQEPLLIYKLKQCSLPIDMTATIPEEAIEDFHNKTALLNNVFVYVIHSGSLTEAAYPPLLEMIKANLFREVFWRGQELDEDENRVDGEFPLVWPHLNIVYALLRDFVYLPHLRLDLCEPFIDKNFIKRLIDLLDSEVKLEREHLKHILQRIYKRFPKLRACFRRDICFKTLTYTFENITFNGMDELLEILAVIIRGFTQPLRPQHRNILLKVLMPLHQAHLLKHFHTELVACVKLFLEKDPELVDQVMQRLIRYWPITNSIKKGLFLNEVEELMNQCQNLKLTEAFFKKFKKTLCSWHSQVSFRSFDLLQKQCVRQAIEQDPDKIMPIILPAFTNILDDHWVKGVRRQAKKALIYLKSIQPELFETLISKQGDPSFYKEIFEENEEDDDEDEAAPVQNIENLINLQNPLLPQRLAFKRTRENLPRLPNQKKIKFRNPSAPVMPADSTFPFIRIVRNPPPVLPVPMLPPNRLAPSRLEERVRSRPPSRYIKGRKPNF